MSHLESSAPGRRERKRQQTLDHLANTAWKLFEALGFDAVTMERIAEDADVAKGTLYKHFPVKEALLRHIFHRELADALPAIFQEIAGLPTVEAQLHAFLARNAEWSEQHRAYLLPYVRFRLSEAHVKAIEQRSGLDQVFSNLIRQGQANGEFRMDYAPELLANYLEFLYLAVLLRWLLDEGDSLAVEFERMLNVFLQGLRKPE